MTPSWLGDPSLPLSFAALVISLLSYSRSRQTPATFPLPRLELRSKLPQGGGDLADNHFTYVGILENTGNMPIKIKGVWMKCDDQAPDGAYRLHRIAPSFRLVPGEECELRFVVDYARIEDMLRHGFNLRELRFTVDVHFRERFFGPTGKLAAYQENLSIIIRNIFVDDWFRFRDEQKPDPQIVEH